MCDDEIIVIGGLLLLMLTGSRERIPWGAGWHWPVDDLIVPFNPLHPGEEDYPAVITQEFKPGRHLGVDIAYRRFRDNDEGRGLDRPEYQPPHDSTQNLEFFAPPGRPILAARDGVVHSVGPSPRGISVVIDHGYPFLTFYQHLETTRLPAHVDGHRVGGGDAIRVKRGDVIGTMGYDPIDPEGFRHLHFAIWYKGWGDKAAVDPTDMLRIATRSARML